MRQIVKVWVWILPACLWLLLQGQIPIYDQEVSCPSLTCTDYLGEDVCYMHSGGPPVSYIKFAQCPSESYCDFHTDWAFFSQRDQAMHYSVDPHRSQSYKHLTQSSCLPLSFFRRELNPGRVCESNFQCHNFNCTDFVCKGKESGDNCQDHLDCDVGMACIADTDYPYETTCKAFRQKLIECENDYECDFQSVCWYYSKDDFYTKTKVCMQKYYLLEGQTFGWAYHHYDEVADMKYNGRVCASGLARPLTFSNATSNDTHPTGQCIQFYGVRTDQGFFSNNETATCLARNPGSFCYYYTDENLTDYFFTGCHCGFDSSIGYCPLPNPANSSLYAALDFWTEGNSTSCHTLDRYDHRAYFECGVGESYLLRNFTREKVVFEHWPQAQNEEIKDCMVRYYKGSYEDISYDKSGAVRMVLGLVAAVLIL